MSSDAGSKKRKRTSRRKTTRQWNKSHEVFRLIDARTGERISDYWYADYMGVDGKRRNSVKVGTNVQDAINSVRKIKLDRMHVKRGVTSEIEVELERKRNIPVHEAKDAYFSALVARRLTASHVSQSKDFINRILRHLDVKHVGLLEVSDAKIAEYLDSMLLSDYAGETVNAVRNRFAEFCNYLVKLKYMRSSPMRGIPVVDVRSSAKRVSAVLEVRDFQSIMNHPHRCNQKHALWVLFRVRTGLRTDESKRLRVYDLDGMREGDPWIAIDGSRTKNGLALTIPLSDDLVVMLNQMLEGRQPNPNELLFPQVPTLKVWKSMLERAGVPYRVRQEGQERIHDRKCLRDTCITFMYWAGVDETTRKKIANHDQNKKKRMQVKYTKLRLLDELGAVNQTAEFAPVKSPEAFDSEHRATGTCDQSAEPLANSVTESVLGAESGVESARYVFPTSSQSTPVPDRPSESIRGGSDSEQKAKQERVSSVPASAYPMEPIGLEPTTSCMPCKRSPN